MKSSRQPFMTTFDSTWQHLNLINILQSNNWCKKRLMIKLYLQIMILHFFYHLRNMKNSLCIALLDFSCPSIFWTPFSYRSTLNFSTMSSSKFSCTSCSSIIFINHWMKATIWSLNIFCRIQQVVKTSRTKYTFKLDLIAILKNKLNMLGWKHTTLSIKCYHKAVFARFWDL
jgi:hypothetical protein